MIAAFLSLALVGNHAPAFIGRSEYSAPVSYRQLPERQLWLRCQSQAADQLAVKPKLQQMLSTFWPIQSTRLLFSELDEARFCQAEFKSYSAIRDVRLGRDLRNELVNDDWNDVLIICAQVVERRHLHRKEDRKI